MRRDAEQRRKALIQAARTCFGEHGYSAPLDEIARRAGVGRGTLYRNFKDRLALLVAIFDHDIDEAQAQVAGMDDLDAVLAALVVRAGPLSALYSRLALELPQDEPTRAGFAALERRTEHLLQPIVERAQAQGLIRPDVGGAEIKMLLRMAGGLILPSHSPAEARALCERALALIMGGLRPH